MPNSKHEMNDNMGICVCHEFFREDVISVKAMSKVFSTDSRWKIPSESGELELSLDGNKTMGSSGTLGSNYEIILKTMDSAGIHLRPHAQQLMLAWSVL